MKNLHESAVDILAHGMVAEKTAHHLVHQAVVFARTHLNPFGCGYTSFQYRVTDRNGPLQVIDQDENGNGDEYIPYDSQKHGGIRRWYKVGDTVKEAPPSRSGQSPVHTHEDGYLIDHIGYVHQ